MKKKIAIFANGWGGEYLHEVVTGVFEVAKQVNIDIFSFINFASTADVNQNNMGEVNIFNLADIKDFDGAILLGNSFNIQEEFKYIYDKIMGKGVPVVSIEYDFKGVTSITTDNYYGMHELAKHVIEVHKAREIVFVGGPKKHTESAMRLKAILDVMEENNMVMPKENILYGDWAQNRAKRLVTEWLMQNKHLPDAFLCANDVMAVGVCDLLKTKGYSVPKDVIVTGYDCIEIGRDHNPIITSVSHKWHDMGEMAMQILLDKMQGREPQKLEPVKTMLVNGTSCGCSAKETAGIRKKIDKNHYYEGFDAWLCDSHFRHIYQAVKKAENADQLHESLCKLFEAEHWMEGDTFKICLEPEFFDIEEKDENLSVEGHSKQVDVICGMQDGRVLHHQVLPLNEVLFHSANEKQESCISIYLPLSSEGKTYGFAILQRNIDIILANRLYIWTRHMNQYLEQARHNIVIADLMRKLTNLSVTDVLTGVYNRAGCEKIAYPMLEQYKQSGEVGVVMMADVDRMKNINDEYGHECGDLALRIVASVLKSQVPTDWVISRFGGDEFFIGGKVEPTTDLEVLVEAIMKKLDEEIKRRKITFDLKMSIGYSIIDPKSKENVEKNLQQADKLMYVVKKCHHETSKR